MNIIFSEIRDHSTSKVIDWFRYNELKVLRHNGDNDETNYFKFHNKVFNVLIDNETEVYQYFNKNNTSYSTKKEPNTADSIWYRRPYSGTGDFNLEGIKYNGLEVIHENIKLHYKSFKDFLVENFGKKKLGSYNVTSLNKLDVLKVAKNSGLRIPKTLVTNSKSNLNHFLSANEKTITKVLHSSFRNNQSNNNLWFTSKTELILKTDTIPSIFAPSLFQEYIDKKYEIRIFYLDGLFFSACIFSQKNEKTMIDFRNYDNTHPNRIVPYNLPEKIKNNLTKLMSKLELNCGSIDLLRSFKGEYVFLEVNPVGQYDFISEACAFNIDMEIVNYLKNE